MSRQGVEGVRATRRCTERGAVAVEFALVLPILVMLLLGVTTSGIAFSNSLGLTNAVREGSRFAAISPYPPVTGNWATDVIARTRAVQFDDPSNSTRICVNLYKQGTGSLVNQCGGPSALGTPAAFTAPSGTPAGSCAVRVWAARSFTIDALLIRFPNRTMTKQSVAVYERSPCGS